MTSGQSEAAEMIETSNPWDAAVDWPDKVGLWAALAGDVVLPVWVASGMKQAIVTDTLGVHLLRDDGYKFLPVGVMLPPPPPKPSKWDYVPQAGDIVWVRHNGGKLVKDYPFRVFVSHGKLKVDALGAVSSLRDIGYRFALATVSPPPGADE